MSSNKSCPICKSGSIRDFLLRQYVPVHQNLLIKDRLLAINISRGDLDLVVCEDCGFVFNRAFDPSKLQYGQGYDNAQFYSPSFRAYLDGLVHHLIADRRVRDCHVVEIGCGQGLFLRKLVEYEGAGNIGYGFDPSYQGALVDLDGRLRFQRRNYDEQCADVPADVAVCRHVIEHIPDPLSLLHSVRNALVHSKNARIFCETPCAEWILRNQVIWDFFYEHCSYFTATSLRTAFELSGFQVLSVQHIFGGQYLWLEARVSGDSEDVRSAQNAVPLVRLAEEFAQAERSLVERWRTRIQGLAAREKVALWGAGAKGVTFANLIEPRAKWIDCIVDVNPQKQGCYLPGTGHPIVAPGALAERCVAAAILMNPNYRDENLAILQRSHLDVRLIEKI
jgi:SAM-dependent methyltransferase